MQNISNSGVQYVYDEYSKDIKNENWENEISAAIISPPNEETITNFPISNQNEFNSNYYQNEFNSDNNYLNNIENNPSSYENNFDYNNLVKQEDVNYEDAQIINESDIDYKNIIDNINNGDYHQNQEEIIDANYFNNTDNHTDNKYEEHIDIYNQDFNTNEVIMNNDNITNILNSNENGNYHENKEEIIDDNYITNYNGNQTEIKYEKPIFIYNQNVKNNVDITNNDSIKDVLDSVLDNYIDNNINNNIINYDKQLNENNIISNSYKNELPQITRVSDENKIFHNNEININYEAHINYNPNPDNLNYDKNKIINQNYDSNNQISRESQINYFNINDAKIFSRSIEPDINFTNNKFLNNQIVYNNRISFQSEIPKKKMDDIFYNQITRESQLNYISDIPISTIDTDNNIFSKSYDNINNDEYPRNNPRSKTRHYESNTYKNNYNYELDYDENGIDQNILQQYMLFKEFENNEEIIELKKENKKLKKNIYKFEKEKKIFNKEKELFLQMRDKTLQDNRKNEENLKIFERELEQKYKEKKNEIKIMMNKLNEDKQLLEQERYNMNNNDLINSQKKELKDKEMYINTLKREIQEKEQKINELENKCKELEQMLIQLRNNKNNQYNDIQDNDKKYNDIQDNDNFPENSLADIQDIDEFPENNENKNIKGLIFSEDNKDRQKRNENELIINQYNPCLGLLDIENPIYMNSILQCFAHIPEITDLIINIHLDPNFENKPSYNLEFLKNYRSILINMFFPERTYNYNKNPIKPIQLRNALFSLNPEFKENENIRIKDFIDFLINRLHEELNIKNEFFNKSKNNKNINMQNENEVLINYLEDFTNNNNSYISKNLYGINKSTLYCHECQNTFYNFSPFSYLFFNLSKVLDYKINKYKKDSVELNLLDCLDYYQKTQTLLGDNGLFCPVCNHLTESTAINNIYSAKDVIIIYFEKDENEDNFNFDLDEVINLTDYIQYKRDGDKTKEKYFLTGIVNYSEDNYGKGKYKAFCNMSKNNVWYCYDNENVYPLDFKDVKTNGFPILLFYHKMPKN